MNEVGIMELRGDGVVRELIFFAEPWEPPACRARWVERKAPKGTPAPL